MCTNIQNCWKHVIIFPFNRNPIIQLCFFFIQPCFFYYNSVKIGLYTLCPCSRRQSFKVFQLSSQSQIQVSNRWLSNTTLHGSYAELRSLYPRNCPRSCWGIQNGAYGGCQSRPLCKELMTMSYRGTGSIAIYPFLGCKWGRNMSLSLLVGWFIPHINSSSDSERDIELGRHIIQNAPAKTWAGNNLESDNPAWESQLEKGVFLFLFTLEGNLKSKFINHLVRISLPLFFLALSLRCAISLFANGREEGFVGSNNRIKWTNSMQVCITPSTPN